jgi:hypothetical protein
MGATIGTSPLLISGVSLCHHALIKSARMVHWLNDPSDFIASCKNRLIGEKFAFGLDLLETGRAAIAVSRVRDATEGHECECDCQCGLSDAVEVSHERSLLFGKVSLP